MPLKCFYYTAKAFKNIQNDNKTFYVETKIVHYIKPDGTHPAGTRLHFTHFISFPWRSAVLYQLYGNNVPYFVTNKGHPAGENKGVPLQITIIF